MINLKIKSREITAPALKHILGVDQLRYVFAIWVFFAHGGGPPFLAGHVKTQAFDFLDHLYGWSINGQAAVIGFFIISGLCIHYPNIRRKSLDLKSFYTARLLRLSLPLLACLVIAQLINFHPAKGIVYVVPIWTLYCEFVYYLLYPIVLWIVKKGVLIHFIVLTCFLSFILIIIWAGERSMYFHEIGGGGLLYWKAALLAFPCWLFGVLIAERMSDASRTNKVAQSKQSLWPWRIGAVCLSMITFPLFRVGLYFKLITRPLTGLIFASQFTLLLFGIYCFYWIEKEVLYNNFGKAIPSKLLERFGLASYSLYLVHVMVLWISEQLSPNYFPGYLIFWLAVILTLHVLVYIFYVAVEKPSHKLAKFCASYIRGKTNP